MNPPVPILYTIPNFVTAGSGRAMLNVVERLDRRRFAPSICALKPGGQLEAEIERLGVPYFQASFTVASRPLRTLIQRARRASVHFRPYRFALWHSYHYLDDYTEPLVARFAGAKAWVYTKKNMGWNRRSWFLRTLLATRVAAQNSDMIRSFLSSAVFRRRASLLPPGVDVSVYRPGTPRRLRLRAKLRTPEDAVVMGCVAHLVPVKGHPTLLEAVSKVPKVTLWIAGRVMDENYVDGLRAQARELGLEDRVVFLGGIDDIPALLAELDIFVLPTWDAWRMEGCPVALLEAMASGLACVATDIPGSRDVVASGRNGVLVPPRNPTALSEAIRQLALDPGMRREMGRAARERIEERYSIEREVQAYEVLYEEALRLRSAASKTA